MAIKVKAVERKLKFTKNENDPGVYRYVLGAELYTALNQKKVIREAALRSGVSQGVMQACWDAAGEVIKAWATEGHSVALPGLGTMRFGVRAKAVEKVEDVKSGLISARRIIFTPNSDLKEELKATAIQITCYDRNGEVVKRVTSDDEGEVEDTEQAPGSDTGSNTSGTGSNTGDNTGSNTQGGDNTGGGSTGGDDYHDPDGGTNSDE
jgi:predicted histone-like DNA-binding protein